MLLWKRMLYMQQVLCNLDKIYSRPCSHLYLNLWCISVIMLFFCIFLDKEGNVFPLMPNKRVNVCLVFQEILYAEKKKIHIYAIPMWTVQVIRKCLRLSEGIHLRKISLCFPLGNYRRLFKVQRKKCYTLLYFCPSCTSVDLAKEFAKLLKKCFVRISILVKIRH